MIPDSRSSSAAPGEDRTIDVPSPEPASSGGANRAPDGTQRGPGFFVAFCLLATALWILGTGGASNVVPDLGGTPSFDRAQLTTASPRTPLAHPPQLFLNGFERSCEDCHATFEPGERAAAARSESERVQHVDIVISHGRNDRCLGCHHADDRNSLSLLDGTPIRFDAAEQLCRECHGLVGRDWEAGTHGRTHGSWRTGSPEQSRLTCTECHDPHSPAFPRIAPLPGPNTLRLPPPSERPPHSAEPLWPRSAIEASRVNDASRGPH